MPKSTLVPSASASVYRESGSARPRLLNGEAYILVCGGARSAGGVCAYAPVHHSNVVILWAR